MKSTDKTFPELHAEWQRACWALFTASRPTEPPKPPQEAPVQEWEDEGGSIKPPEKKPGAAPSPKIPL